MDIEKSTQLDKKSDPIKLTQESFGPIESVIRTMAKDLAALKGRPSIPSSKDKEIDLKAAEKKAAPPADLPVAKPPIVVKPTIPKPSPLEKKPEEPVRPVLRRNYLRVVTIGLFAIFIIGGIGGVFYWWNYLREAPPLPVTHYECQDLQCVSLEGEGTDQCQTDENCQPVGPVEPESLIPVAGTKTIELTMGQEKLLLDSLKLEAATQHSQGSFWRILVKLVSQTEQKYADLDTLASGLGITLPENIRQSVVVSDVEGGNYTLFFYSQPAGNRLGIIIDMEEDGLESVLNLWEKSMAGDLELLFLRTDVPIAFSSEFQDNDYQEVAIRYLNFPGPDLTIDYAVINNKLVITTSRESMYGAIDVLVETLPEAETLPEETIIDEGSEEEVEEITDEQSQEILDILSEGVDYYNNLVSQGDPEAVQKAVDWFKAQEAVEDAKAVSGAIWVKFKAAGKEATIFF